MKINRCLLFLVVGLVLSLIFPIHSFAGMPKPTQTKYLKTTGAGFSIDQRAGALFYALSFKVREKLKSPLFVKIQFENPGDENTPFLKKTILFPKQKVLRTESPTFKKIKNTSGIRFKSFVVFC